VFSLGDWHHQYLENLEKEFKNSPMLKEKYEVKNSNKGRLYLPDWKGIKRKEILSNPDMLLLSKKGNTPEYIIELEYNINYKKLVGIALLTDIAVGKMELEKKRPKLILIARQKFSNDEFIGMEIKKYVKKIEFSLFTTDAFNSSMIS